MTLEKNLMAFKRKMNEIKSNNIIYENNSIGIEKKEKKSLKEKKKNQEINYKKKKKDYKNQIEKMKKKEDNY